MPQVSSGTPPGKKYYIMILIPRSAISGFFESLGQDVDRFPLNGGNLSGFAPVISAMATRWPKSKIYGKIMKSYMYLSFHSFRCKLKENDNATLHLCCRFLACKYSSMHSCPKHAVLFICLVSLLLAVNTWSISFPQGLTSVFTAFIFFINLTTMIEDQDQAHLWIPKYKQRTALLPQYQNDS